ncbi:DNA helicase [Ruegeria sp. WL0004]|uniref:DNA helicase n=1 Tax=Ruegeria marisflavi TaxID=2984152 RepID=A0ABT2WSP2_9RHOB|nr:DNA helicase [Ruegeria sp. WL0004]MCU9838919.1 DNA helicase [Ruegeria sp. WL0004]
MWLSTPVYVLKRQAKLLARQTDTPLNQALDKVASGQGYQSWSHLAATLKNESPARELLSQLKPGDLCLVGARPSQGKTLLGLELAARASRVGRKSFFFTLDYHERDVADRFASMGIARHAVEHTVVVDTSDDVSADYIIRRLRSEQGPTLVVVDYLQLLDQKRTNPSLNDQLRVLCNYAADTGSNCVVLSQIDRRFDMGSKRMPGKSDIRAPNPIDLSAFGKFVFLHNGKLQFDQAA